jgi:hypothetical protein
MIFKLQTTTTPFKEDAIYQTMATIASTDGDYLTEWKFAFESFKTTHPFIMSHFGDGTVTIKVS